MKSTLFGALFMVGGTISGVCIAILCTPNQPAFMLASAQPAKSVTAGFNADIYLMAYPDVAKQIQAGKFKSALDHYEKVGQSGKDANGEAIGGFFTGTAGNDTITGFGQAPHLSGVGLEVVRNLEGPLPMRPTSLGIGEIDTLIATRGSSNEILLGSFKTVANPKAQPFYVGKGDADYVRVQNFTKSKDALILAGDPKQYRFESVKGDLRISTVSGDLIAIVEGVDKLAVGESSKEFGIFGLE
ncbi:MAG: hypothetical protein KME27_16865 [Lyngbya sp. HA4199-MV5]|jgi:hypothetical protein|nr:hypothetical protein [Lyngbya sp. HA4199-MV5]